MRRESDAGVPPVVTAYLRVGAVRAAHLRAYVAGGDAQ